MACWNRNVLLNGISTGHYVKLFGRPREGKPCKKRLPRARDFTKRKREVQIAKDWKDI